MDQGSSHSIMENVEFVNGRAISFVGGFKVNVGLVSRLGASF